MWPLHGCSHCPTVACNGAARLGTLAMRRMLAARLTRRAEEGGDMGIAWGRGQGRLSTSQ